MKNLTAKQQERLEKKKKKLSALAEMIKLNDEDRSIKPNLKSCPDNTEELNDIQNGNNKKTWKRFAQLNEKPEETFLKKPKLNQGSSGDQEVESLTVIETNTIGTTINNTTGCQIRDEEYQIMKREVLEKKRLSRQIPKLRLRELGDCAKLTVDQENRTPLFLTDIQHLLMAALIGPDSPCAPSRWCSLDKIAKLSSSVVLIVEGISLFHYLSYEQSFITTNSIFDDKLEIILPSLKDSKILEELATVPLTNAQKDALIEKYGSLELAIEMNKDPTFMVKTVFPINTDDNINENELNETSDPNNTDKFPRTKLLLSALQMVDEGYPLPLRGQLRNKYEHYKFTKAQYDQVTPNSPLFGVDCEMCKTSLGINELTRISIVDENLKTVYDTLVRPTNKIIDYLTQYSGITPDMMMSVTKVLHEVQKDVQNLLPPNAILVGQSLNVDLHALHMMHPYVIDTSVIFNLTGERRRKSKLQILAKTFLDEVIQDNLYGHDSIEDSASSLKLTKLKLERGLDFGDAILQRKNNANEILKEKLKISNNLFASISTATKTSAIVTVDDIDTDFIDILEGNYKINCCDNELTANKNGVSFYKTDGNKAAIQKVRDIYMEHALTIANINVAPQQLELSRIEKTMLNIDKCIGKLYSSLEHHSMFVVLFGGSPCSTSGVAMIKIKKNLPNLEISGTM